MSYDHAEFLALLLFRRRGDDRVATLLNVDGVASIPILPRVQGQVKGKITWNTPVQLMERLGLHGAGPTQDLYTYRTHEGAEFAYGPKDSETTVFYAFCEHTSDTVDSLTPEGAAINWSNVGDLPEWQRAAAEFSYAEAMNPSESSKRRTVKGPPPSQLVGLNPEDRRILEKYEGVADLLGTEARIKASRIAMSVRQGGADTKHLRDVVRAATSLREALGLPGRDLLDLFS